MIEPDFLLRKFVMCRLFDLPTPTKLQNLSNTFAQDLQIRPVHCDCNSITGKRLTMTDLNLTNLLLNGMTTYGAVVFGLALLLGALGVPVPSTLMVLAAGAFARQDAIDWRTALPVGLLGVVMGDNASYAIGRFANGWAQCRFSRSPAWQAAQHRFAQRGALAVYATRFLFTPLAIPTNLIAGGSGYNFQRFFTYDVAGEFTWLVLYGGLGYAFASQWSIISRTISNYSGYLMVLVIIGVAGYFVAQYLARSFKKFNNCCGDSAQNLHNCQVQ
jgi:membrane-associated protein